MNRGVAFALALLAGLLASIAILAPVFFVSWRFAVTEQKREVDHSARRMLERAEAIYAEATSALNRIAAAEAEPCGPEHTALMRQATIDDLFIDNIAYAADGYVRCNAYGPVTTVVAADEIDVVQPDGTALNVNWIWPTQPPRPTLIVKLGGHRALIDQRSFYDELVSPEAAGHFTLRTLNGIPIEAELAGEPGLEPADEGRDLAYDLSSANWIVSVAVPLLAFPAYVESLATIVLPLAATLSLIFAAVFLWLLLRPVSGKALIERALRQGHFIVHYQPIIDLATQRCVAAEALVRLRGADGVLVRPDVFIPYAEDSGLIQPLTDHILQTVVREMGPLLRENRSMHISINIAATDFASGRILEALDRALKDADINPDQIWLEMTERALMNIEDARATLDELRRRGHCIAIDDFGTGYSGLQYLAKLPVGMLKIDKSFIETVGTAAPTSRVTGHIIALARELKLGLVAEGVETDAQATILRNEGVEYAQGWLFSRAIPADEFLAFLKRNATEPARRAGKVASDAA